MPLINIIESFSESKRGDPDGGDDRWIVTDAFAAVIDGATTSAERIDPTRTNGAFAADCVRTTIEKWPADIDPAKALESMTFAVANGARQDSAVDAFQRPSACVVILHALRRELWLVGDCQALVLGSEQSHVTLSKSIDDLASSVRAAVLEAHRIQGRSADALRKNDPGRQAIEPLLAAQRQFQNRPGWEWSYWVIDGQSLPEEAMQIVPIDDDANEIVLASDGYPRLCPTLEETEYALEHLLRLDVWAPLMFRGPSRTTKGVPLDGVGFDDRTYVRVAFCSG